MNALRPITRRTARKARSLGFACLGLTACLATQAQTLTVWVHSGTGPERDAYVATVKVFNERPLALRGSVVAELALVPEASYGEEVTRAAAEGKLPCVLEFDGPNVAAYAMSGRLMPLERFSGLIRVRDSMLSSLVRQGTVDGKLYSVGQYDSGLGLWGNRELLQKVGVRIPERADNGWTLAEFEDLLKKLKAAGVASPLDMKFNYGVAGEWFSYGFAPLLQGFGGDLIDRNDYRRVQGVLNGPASVKAMTTLQKWIQSGYVDRSPADDKAFVEGRAALSWVGHWVFKDYRQALGDRLVLLPLPRFGARPVTGSGSWNFGIAASCPYPEAAAAFLEHLMSRTEILRVTEVNGAVPGTGAAMVFSPYYGPGGALRLYADQLLAGYARVRPPTPHYPLLSQTFADAVDKISKGADVQRTLDTAAAAIDQGIGNVSDTVKAAR